MVDEPSHARVQEFLRQGKAKEALGQLLAVLTGKALSVLEDHDIPLRMKVQSEPPSALEIAGGVASVAREEFETMRGEMDAAAAEKVEHACDLLDAIFYCRARLEPVKANSADDMAKVLVDLVFIGGMIGQSDLALDGSLAGIWQDAANARRHREGRRKAAGETALKRTAWKAQALETARAICERNAALDTTELAERVKQRLPHVPMSHVPLLNYLRHARRDGTLPKKPKG